MELAPGTDQWFLISSISYAASSKRVVWVLRNHYGEGCLKAIHDETVANSYRLGNPLDAVTRILRIPYCAQVDNPLVQARVHGATERTV